MIIKNFAEFNRVENSIDYPGAVFIQHNEAPYFWGQVWKFKEAGEMNRFLQTMPPAAFTKISGYNILIAYAGNLENARITTGGELKMLQSSLERMANFYYHERIKQNESYYKKFACAKAGPAGPR